MSGLTFTVRRTASLLPQVARAFDDWQVEAGIFESAGPHNNSDDGESVAQIAHRNEYGIEVPERPAFRASFFDNRRKYQRKLLIITRRGFQGRRLTRRDFDPLGREAKNDIEHSIASGPWLANADSTQLRKGGGHQLINSPLIDTGQMIDSVDFRVHNR